MANVKDLVDDGVNGLLFQSGSAEALAATLIAALSDDNLRIKLGKAALIETSRRLNWPANASRVIKEYERLI
jgi:glycosyltransferase involved in cell wall biosynthesis